MRDPLLPAPQTQPAFSSLFWDNIRTFVVYGAVITGGIPGAAGFLPGVLLDLTCGNPRVPLMGIITGTIVGGACAIPGAILGALAAIPLTISAEKTRKFIAVAKIDAELKGFKSLYESDEQKRKNIINQIVKEYRDKKLGIRSTASLNLIRTLTRKPFFRPKDTAEKKKQAETRLIQEKWAALKHYMDEKTGNNDNHINNGKLLFNTVLSVVSTEKTALEQRMSENSLVLKRLKNINCMINANDITEAGRGFFNKKTPTGIQSMQKAVEDALKEKKSFDELTPGDRYLLLAELVRIACNRLENSDQRRAIKVTNSYKIVAKALEGIANNKSNLDPTLKM